MSEAQFILDHAERLLTVATRCAWSFGAADGLNDLLSAPPKPEDVWRHQVSVLQRDAMLMSVIRVETMLDSEQTAVSFQTVYHRLKEPDVQAALLAAIETRRGEDVFEERSAHIAEYLEIYRSIDWGMVGRLKHLRNLDVAHLRIQPRTKSIDMKELQCMVAIVSRLAEALQALLQTDIPFHAHIVAESREDVKRALASEFPHQ